jgi:hypothetical protein
MAWTWRYEAEGGAPVDPAEAPAAEAPAAEAPAAEAFPTQADAETWLGENWRELRHAGVFQVSLLDGERVVYGGMSLSAPDSSGRN